MIQEKTKSKIVNQTKDFSSDELEQSTKNIDKLIEKNNTSSKIKFIAILEENSKKLMQGILDLKKRLSQKKIQSLTN